MEIGQRKVVHTNLSPGENSRPDEIVVITITDKRSDVPYTFGKGTGDGYKAVDSKGVVYECHWDHFPDDSMNPNCCWIRITDPEMFWDIIDAVCYIDFKPKFLDGEIGEILDYCPEHECLFYKYKISSIYDGCFQCYLDKTYPDSESTLEKRQLREERKAKSARWVGWK
jgi:hypothetical protein